MSTDKPVGATLITWDCWAELFETAGYVALTPGGV